MTLPRLLALTKYWQTTPPVHESVAAFLGTSKPASDTKTASDGTTAEVGGTVDDSDEVGIALMRAFGGAGGIIAAGIQAP